MQRASLTPLPNGTMSARIGEDHEYGKPYRLAMDVMPHPTDSDVCVIAGLSVFESRNLPITGEEWDALMLALRNETHYDYMELERRNGGKTRTHRHKIR